jgi:hypothetical protein
MKLKTYKTTISPTVSHACEFYVSRPKNNHGLTVCENKVLRRRENRWDEMKENGEKCTMKKFIICTLRQLLLCW